MDSNKQQEENIATTGIPDSEAISSMPSESQSVSSPSSSSYEEMEEEKEGDVISLSTSSMSTNPTPENPLYASRGSVLSKSHKAGVGEAETNKDDNRSKSCSILNKAKPNDEDCSSCLSSSGVVTSGLHEDFNRSPEPIVGRKMQQNSKQFMPDTADGRDDRENIVKIASCNGHRNAKNENIATKSEKDTNTNEITPATDNGTDSGGNTQIVRSSPNLSSMVSSLGSGSQIGANFVLRDTTNKVLNKTTHSNNLSTTMRTSLFNNNYNSPALFFTPQYICTKIAYSISRLVFDDASDDFAVATWLGFWAYLNVSCANLILKPIMDAVVLELGVENQPKLILASSILAFLSSVPIGWLFEAPDPKRRKVFKKMGMTRGETQGTSLALFYRFFAFSAISYAFGFKMVNIEWIFGTKTESSDDGVDNKHGIITFLFKKWGQCMYIAFFLVIHLMKLHSTSLVWGVTTEAMEYEEIARKQNENSLSKQTSPKKAKKEKTRLQRLARIQFGGTLGSIWGRYVIPFLTDVLLTFIEIIINLTTAPISFLSFLGM